jgi:RHH-type transcriptional regulator, rel operon repressor / antitoxin RelB
VEEVSFRFKEVVMVEVQLEPELEERLERVATAAQVTKSFVAREAIERFIEDREDYLAGIRSLSQSKYTISQEEMERLSSVAD